MTAVGIHASHEQLHPTDLFALVRRAEEAGFGAAMCSDHLEPWGRAQGHSAFAWAWLGAALAGTSRLTFGSVTAPGQRYHPVVAAQAVATLEAMYPGRTWVALGSGENLNEHVTGAPWPPKDVRDARLRECVEVIRALLAGQEVTHHGLVEVDSARLWTLPEQPPPLFGAAITPQTAAAHADWADGLITTNQPLDDLRKVVEAYRSAGGRGDLAVQVHLAWAPSLADAERTAVAQWGTNTFPPPRSWDLASPEAFEAASTGVGIDEVREVVHVTDSLTGLGDYLGALVEAGADRLYLHHVSADRAELERFVDAFAERVLPQLS